MLNRTAGATASQSILLGLCAWICGSHGAFSADSKTIKPFDGESLAGWTFKEPKEKSQWVVGEPTLADNNPKTLAANPGTGALINPVSGHRESVDIYSKEKFGSCRIKVDVMVAEGANSGVYVHGEYEIQVLDSYGKEKLGPGDMGAIYGANPPTVNACRKPGVWQTYEIVFHAPKFDDSGEKTENARFEKVILNGETLHEDVILEGPTPSGVTGKEAPTGPIMFQGDHGPVAYRNIEITPLH